MESDAIKEIDLEESVSDIKREFRRMAEAGVVLTWEEWGDLPEYSQNLYLEAKQRIKEIDLAIFLELLLEQLKTGQASKDLIFEELSEEQQAGMLKEKSHQNAVLARMRG